MCVYVCVGESMCDPTFSVLPPRAPPSLMCGVCVCVCVCLSVCLHLVSALADERVQGQTPRRTDMAVSVANRTPLK